MGPHLGGWHASIKPLCLALMFLLLVIAAVVPSGFSQLVEADRRLVTVGRRLAKGGSDLCEGVVSNPGWIVADVEQYPPSLRPAAKAALGIGDRPTVIAVESGSPAWAAGLRPGDELAEVHGAEFDGPLRNSASRRRQLRLEEATVSGLRTGQLRVIAGAGHDQEGHEVRAEQGCASDFVVSRATGLLGASSNGKQVGVSLDILDYVANDDELALILAHELAHNILGHNKGVPAFRAAGEDRSGRSKKSREAEADRWALYLMTRAGYDVSVAPGFWRRWGPKTSFGIFNSGSHPGWRERADAAEAEIARIKAQQQAGQQPIP
jgi:beta-barrel assembly-enhancing protease